jgi:predicted HicB family RNase H-like nuclease
MGLSTEMKNLSEEILSSFKQRIKENDELVTEVQKTLEGFQKGHQEMTAVLNADAAALRKGLASDEKERLNTYNELMTGIHSTIDTIQKEVVAIQTSTLNMITEFTSDRADMAVELDKSFAQGREGREKNEKARIKEFNALMNDINADVKNINEEVLSIFKSTNEMLEKFDKEHSEMSAELKAELSKNLAERVNYTLTLLNGFQKRLSEISKENHQMAQELRKDLANGETDRLNGYEEIMKGINTAIKAIRKDVKDIQKTTSTLIGDYAQDRSHGAAEWKKMQDTIAQLNEKGFVEPAKEVKKEVKKKEAPVKKAKETPVVAKPVKKAKETPVVAKPAEKVMEAPAEESAKIVKEAPVKATKPIAPITLEEKILDYVNKHPKGVSIAEMEKPLGETRMKLGYVAKNLLDAGKVQKIEKLYFPKK